MSETVPSSADGVVRLVEDLLTRAIHLRASDVHFEPGDAAMRVRFRVDGLLQEVDRIPGELAENVIARLKVLAGLLTYRVDIPQEGSFVAEKAWLDDGPAIDVRVATFPTVRGERAVVRFLYTVGEVNELEGLGLSAEVVAELRRAADRPHGLILVTGPAGSGKSTTLYAMARHILTTTPGRSVVSLEDPVEQRVAGMAQIQVSPHGELNYIRAMRSLLRQDVEVLIVGEIRDAETAHIVVEASLTGHLILSTLHSGDPAEAIVRLVEMGIAPYQLVGAVTVVCAQRLMRTLRSTVVGTADSEVGRYGSGVVGGDDASMGYRGRTACGQIAVMDEPLRQAILDRRPASELRQLIGERRPDLAADARRLVEAGRTDVAEVRRVLGAFEGDR